MSSGGAQIPTTLQPYNSYKVDPTWQRKFTIIWTSVLAFFVLISLPHLVRSIRRGRGFTGLFGISEDWIRKPYAPVQEDKPPQRRETKWWEKALGRVLSMVLWTIPGTGANLGRVVLVAGYIVTVILCIVLKSDLTYNSNRAGFMAVAQLPVIFLFATKNSILSVLLGPGHGYEKLNIIHRWSGRMLFLSAAVHGTMWIHQHLTYNLPILGQQKETSGIASFSLLCIIFLSSLRPVRRFFYQGFFMIHVLGYSAFFITICTHTPYASPWIFPPIAFYGLDLLLRMFKFRIKDATLVPVGKQMTLINVHDCNGGWQAGQHVRLRVFFHGRIFESHPLTILNAPSPTYSGLNLGARAVGDWTRALNGYAHSELERLAPHSEKKTGAGVPVQVMMDGPYGGCSIDLGDYESVLLVSGGSGATFSLAMLDDIITRCIKHGRPNGERTRRIEFAWCIRSFGCIDWFAPVLMDLANAASGTSLDLHISIFVTCLCNPEAVPAFPNSIVTLERPVVRDILHKLITPPGVGSGEGPEQTLHWAGVGGGVGVCASGPDSLTTEVSNVIARMGLPGWGGDIGSVGLHTEVFSL